MADQPVKSGRGGKRPGAGRPKGSTAPQVPDSLRGGARSGAGRKRTGARSPSALSSLELRAVAGEETPDEIEPLAQRHVRIALDAWVTVVKGGLSESARVAACKAILDRGFGKPAVDIGGETLPLFGPAPDKTISRDMREEARKSAPLAIACLRKIAENGTSETARVMAGTVLMDRGLGTVGIARMPEIQLGKPLGKKEEAQRAAELRATGAYAPPGPPRHEVSRLQ